MITKEECLYKLRTLTREITCMSESRFNENCEIDRIKFENFCWDEPAKIEITFKKIALESLKEQGSDGE